MASIEFTVPHSFAGLLYEDGVFTRQLEPGKYALKENRADRVERKIDLLDIRERSLTIKGQEILTADKVAIRVSLLVYFRVTDPQAAAHNVANYEERIYEDVQLAARRFLSSRDLEAILVDRNEISDAVRDEVTSAAGSYGVRIVRADVKDLIFPGNLREIMNQVLETERRAEARLIEARKNAEVQKIHLEAANEAKLAEIKTEQERVRFKLQSELEEAKAFGENPHMLRLRQLDVLKEMARKGARFTIGLKDSGLVSAFALDDED